MTILLAKSLTSETSKKISFICIEVVVINEYKILGKFPHKKNVS